MESPDESSKTPETTDILKENVHDYRKSVKPKNRLRLNSNGLRLLVAILLIIIIVGVLTSITNLGKEKNSEGITGYAVFSGEEGSEEIDPSTEPEAGGEEDAFSPTYAEGNPTILKNIRLNADIELQSYKLDLNNIDMSIDAKSLIVVTPSVDLEINPEEEINLQSFTGELEFSDGKLMLSGELDKYLSNYLTMKFKNTEEQMILMINQGTIKIGKIEIDKLEAVATGKIGLNQMTIWPNLETVTFEDYEGSFETKMEYDKNLVSLTGDVGLVKTNINGVEVNID